MFSSRTAISFPLFQAAQTVVVDIKPPETVEKREEKTINDIECKQIEEELNSRLGSSRCDVTS